MLTAAAATALLLGPALIAVWWIARDGLTTFALAWIAIALAWVALLVAAAVRNPETRGWIAVGLFGWLGLLVAAARADKPRPIVIRVLHIDDEAPIRLLCRVNLGGAAMEVIEAADGWTGVLLARREQPNLILLNVNLPPGVGSPDPAWSDPGNAGGWLVAEELRKHEETRAIPVVFLTGRAALRDLTRGFDLGAVDYITKPFNPAELAERLRGVMERVERGERDELRRERLSELRALGDPE